jgi:hypothetical protein
MTVGQLNKTLKVPNYAKFKETDLQRMKNTDKAPAYMREDFAKMDASDAHET